MGRPRKRPLDQLLPPPPPREPRKPIRDVLGREGAEELAAEIEVYWHDRGHPQVRAWVEGNPQTTLHCGAVYSVRTNLVCGMPPPPDRLAR